jgi:hypothetical protein
MLLPLCCRWITGTAVDPTLPVQCTVEGSTLKLHGPPDLPQRQGLPPSAASLVALLVLATLVAGGALGRVLWWRKLRQRGSDSLQRGTHSAGSSRRLQSRAAGHTGTSIGPATAGGAPQPSKRARLAALVQAELGSAASGGIEMMPLDALPATLAHRLGRFGGIRLPLPTRHRALSAAGLLLPAQQRVSTWLTKPTTYWPRLMRCC